MNYKGFNIAVHEMGHNIEQTFSMNLVDYHLLAGVPNTAFTEALAMMDAGARPGSARSDEAGRPQRRALHPQRLLGNGGDLRVALVDMGVWHWMYEHPDATSGRVEGGHPPDRTRSLEIATYAPVFISPT